jgi:hypothetical protein
MLGLLSARIEILPVEIEFILFSPWRRGASAKVTRRQSAAKLEINMVVFMALWFFYGLMLIFIFDVKLHNALTINKM